jgi:filamentous hemagglutinin family protein
MTSKYIITLILIFGLVIHSPLFALDLKNATDPHPHGIEGKFDTQIDQFENIFFISGGKKAGSNLFHVFETFNVHDGEVAIFDDFGFSNTIAKVSGQDYSWINGEITSSADHLFLLNPNGIIFGPNAFLNTGAISVSAGDYISFDDQTFFYGNENDILSTSPPTAFGFIDSNDTSDLNGSIQFNQSEIQGVDHMTFHAKTIKMDQALIALTPIDLDHSYQISIQTPIFIMKNGSQIISYGSLNEQGNDIHILSEQIVLKGIDTNTGFSNLIYTFPEAYTYIQELNEFIALEGHAGTISIQTNTLHMNDGAQISASAKEFGKCGSVEINAMDTILLEGNRLSGDGCLISADVNNGIPGKIDIHTGKLILHEGAQISTSTQGESNGGEIYIHANDFIEISGKDRVAPAPQGSSIIAITQHQGNGGNIDIHAGNLSIQDQGAITTYSKAKEDLKHYGDSGNIHIHTTNEIVVKDRGTISAEALNAGGGVINIASNGKFMFLNSGISSSVEYGMEKGGSVYLDADMFIMKHGKIIAQADQGKGGEISIRANYWICDTTSLISAKSNAGFHGQVELDFLNDDLKNQISLLPENFLKAEKWEKTPCHKRSGKDVSHLYHLPLFGVFSFDTPDFSKADEDELFEKCETLKNNDYESSRHQAWACLESGNRHFEEQNHQNAIKTINKAIFLAESSGDGIILVYCYQTLARIYSTLLETNLACQNYDQAIHLLDPFCRQFYTNTNISHKTFHKTIRPIFEEYVHFLFKLALEDQRSDNGQEYLIKAKRVMEKLKQAELKDFFQDECIPLQRHQQKTIMPSNAVMVYYMVMKNECYIMLSFSDHAHLIHQKISHEKLQAFVQKFRQRLIPESYRYKYYARELYQWLVQPVVTMLPENIDTLWIVPNLKFTSLFSADEQRYLSNSTLCHQHFTCIKHFNSFFPQ